MFAGMTIMNFAPSRNGDVYKHIREVLVPFHEELKGQGLHEAMFLVNPESCQGIGIAIWPDSQKLRDLEQGNTREMAREVRDPETAPTEYTRLRAQWVQDLGGGIVSADWYEVAGYVAPGATEPTRGSTFRRSWP